MTLAVYPGSFDPFTLGHRDILLRSLKIFDQVVIAVGVNQNKKTLFTAEERVEMIEKEVNDIKLDKNNVVKVECFEGLIVDLASKHNFAGIILESPFTSMVKLSKIYYPYLPVKILLKDKYESIKKIDKINFPKMVMHGDKDKIVPFSMGKEMFEKFSEPKLSYFRKDDDHMMEFDEELLEKIKNFLKII